MLKKNSLIIVAVLILSCIGIGGWLYYEKVKIVPIGNVLKNPREYEGRTINIEGIVKDVSTPIPKVDGSLIDSAFKYAKSLWEGKTTSEDENKYYFTLEGNRCEIKVLTNKMLPAVGTRIKVAGKVRQEGSVLENRYLIVFIENIEES